MKRRLVVAALLVLACGKRGDPRPPVPVIPQATSDLVVTQRASNVILSWSYPSITTAGRPLTGIRRISVFRYIEELPAATVGRDPKAILPGDIDPTLPQPVALFSRVPEIPAAQFARLSERVDSIESANLTAASTGARLVYTDTPRVRALDGRPVRVTYAVVTEGSEARSQLSNLATIVPLPVATPPASVTAQASAQGVVVTWAAPTTSVSGTDAPVIAGYNVYRAPAGTAAEDAGSPVNTTPVTATTFTDAPPYGEHEYRVAAVAAVGPPSILSDPSAPARVNFRDLIPPPAPGRLDALVEPKMVRLIWDAVEAADLAGYKVYRSEGVGHGSDIRDIGTIPVVAAPLTTTTFSDPSVDLGIAYRYAVTAVDKSGNESARVWTRWVVAPKTP
ncbi:MAG TPA: hypothetical protein VF111_00490 [Thermoanaerobaculia bacterium]